MLAVPVLSPLLSPTSSLYWYNRIIISTIIIMTTIKSAFPSATLVSNYWRFIVEQNTRSAVWLCPLQGCTTCGSLAAGLRENGEKMREWRGSGERMRKWRRNRERIRKWRAIHSLYCLIFSLFPPSLSISYIKNCLILSQNVKWGTLSQSSQKN